MPPIIYLPLISAIVSALLGSFFGFIWTSKNDKRKDKKSVLATLMAYRGVGAYEHDWVKALNMIDIVFHGNKEVIRLRREYFKHLYHPLYETGAHHRILNDLLFQMAKDIGYNQITQTDMADYYLPERISQLYDQTSIAVPNPTAPVKDNGSEK